MIRPSPWKRALGAVHTTGRLAMEKPSNSGRRRLTILLSCLSGSACALAMAIVLIAFGPPYDSMWWWVMAAVLVGAFALPRLLVFPIEWVIAGYRQEN